MLVLQGKQLIVFIYNYIFRNRHRKKDVCWRQIGRWPISSQLHHWPLESTAQYFRFDSVYIPVFFLCSPSLKLFFSQHTKTNCSPPAVHSTLSKSFLGKSDGMKTSCFHIYGDALSFHTTWGASSPLPVFASCLHWICISYWVLKSLPFFHLLSNVSLSLPPSFRRGKFEG